MRTARTRKGARKRGQKPSRLSGAVLADILQQRSGVGVINGRLYLLEGGSVNPGHLFLCYQNHYHSLREGASLAGKWIDLLDRKPPVDKKGTNTRAVSDPLQEFVYHRLIPRLQTEAATPGEISRIQLETLGSAPVDQPPPRLKSDFMFLDNHWWNLGPDFTNLARTELAIEIYGQRWVGSYKGQRRLATGFINRMIRTGEAGLRTQDPDRGPTRSPTKAIYQDEVHAILPLPDGRLFCCRYLSSYAVEGVDRKLYYFEPVRIGIHLSQTTTAEVLGPGAAVVMQPYKHMFVVCEAPQVSICMATAHSYFRELWKLPLEEAFIRHLEAARLTLCSGYFHNSGSMAHHSIEEFRRPQISEKEAAKRCLPIYRYYRR